MDGPGRGPTTAGRVKQGRGREAEAEAFRNTFSLRDITSAAARERRMPREGKEEKERERESIPRQEEESLKCFEVFEQQQTHGDEEESENETECCGGRGKEEGGMMPLSLAAAAAWLVLEFPPARACKRGRRCDGGALSFDTTCVLITTWKQRMRGGK